jgi:two-component system cell cycle response regulator CtrA
MHILLVEDNPVAAKSIELKLVAEGHNVFTTDLGEDAVELASVYDYDLMLLDLDLSDMEGLDVLRAVRAKKIRTPVIILTASGDIETKVKAGPTISSPSRSTRPSWPRGSTRWCAVRGATRNRSSAPAISRSTSTPAPPRSAARRFT